MGGAAGGAPTAAAASLRQPPPAQLSPAELAVATGGFHSLAEIGEGGFGKVFRAMLHHRPVAIKVRCAVGGSFPTERQRLHTHTHTHSESSPLQPSPNGSATRTQSIATNHIITHPPTHQVMASDGLQGAREADNEAALLPRLQHGHLVRLLGVCNAPGPPPLRALVYELMPGGNVEEQLAAASGPGPPARCVLPWWLRLRVAAQVASAVAYLHGLPAAAGGPLIHRDIKPANWFLDGRLNAKVRGRAWHLVCVCDTCVCVRDSIA